MGLEMWEDQKQHELTMKRLQEEQKKHTAEYEASMRQLDAEMEVGKMKSRLYDKMLQFYKFMKENYKEVNRPKKPWNFGIMLILKASKPWKNPSNTLIH